MTINIDLKCWHCSKIVPIEVSRSPQFGIELIKWAQDVGMTGYIDSRWNRVLLFCNSECARAELTKSGTFRKYPSKRPA